MKKMVKFYCSKCETVCGFRFDKGRFICKKCGKIKGLET